ncbi:hypothetical protein ACGVWS_10975 [Enterobacteriaceae bacterium LUAb1]
MKSHPVFWLPVAALVTLLPEKDTMQAAMFKAVELTRYQECTISVTSDASGVSPLSNLDFGEVNGELLINTTWQIAGNGNTTGMAALRHFWLQLTNCNQWENTGSINIVPKIRLSGALATGAPVSGNSWMFLTNSTAPDASKGFGVVIYSTQTPHFGSDEVPNNGQISVSIPTEPGPHGELTGNYRIPMSAGVTCGRPAWCVASALRQGNMNASIVFTLDYP